MSRIAPVALALIVSILPAVAPAAVQTVTLGDARNAVALNGPWKFHTGDERRWAGRDMDDSGWATVDLTPAPGAHDPDVGLSGWVPGWNAAGYAGYAGYAWYRTRVTLIEKRPKSLAIVGPVLVDSAYQLYVNGRLLGGSGDFSGSRPTAFGVHPVVISVPEEAIDAGRRDLVIAVRVWMGPWAVGDPKGGGIHIAPMLGDAAAIDSEYKADWLERIRGDVLEVLQALLFLILALMALSLFPYDTSNRSLIWLAIALVLTGLTRANLAFFWCSGVESIQTFELAQTVFFVPVALGAWIMTWYHWFKLERIAWFPFAMYAFTLIYASSVFLTRSWFSGVFPEWLSAGAHMVTLWDRRVLLVLLLYIVYCGMRKNGSKAWSALPAIALIAAGQFASELSALGIPGIWFPFGMGVSRTNYAYLLATPALYALLLSVQLRFARHYRTWITAVP